MHRHSAVGECRDRCGELQRGREHVALADADAHGVPGEPFLPEPLPLPILARRDALQLALDVDAGFRAEAHAREEIVDRVDPHVDREPVVVRVARDHDRLVHVDGAVAVLFPVAVAVRDARQRVEARVGDGEFGRALPAFERGERHERLDCRAGRILPAQRPVVERLVGRVVERFPVHRVDAVDEEVGVETGLRDERQHFAGLRIDGDQRPAVFLECFLGDALQLEVEGDDEVVARLRFTSAK